MPHNSPGQKNMIWIFDHGIRNTDLEYGFPIKWQNPPRPLGCARAALRRAPLCFRGRLLRRGAPSLAYRLFGSWWMYKNCCVLATRVSVCHVAFGLHPPQRVMNGFNDGALRLRRLNILYGGLGSSARRLRRPRRGCFHQRPLSLVLQLFGSHQRPFLR